MINLRNSKPTFYTNLSVISSLTTLAFDYRQSANLHFTVNIVRSLVSEVVITLS